MACGFGNRTGVAECEVRTSLCMLFCVPGSSKIPLEVNVNARPVPSLSCSFARHCFLFKMLVRRRSYIFLSACLSARPMDKRTVHVIRVLFHLPLRFCSSFERICWNERSCTTCRASKRILCDEPRHENVRQVEYSTLEEKRWLHARATN